MPALFSFLLIVQALIALAMITVILMQRSEGGGLAGGGSPSGMMSARGASDFLTRSTAILATLFVALSIVLAALATTAGGPRTIDSSLQRQAPVGGTTPAAPSPTSIPGATPGPAQPSGAAPAPAPPAAQGNQSGAPLAQ
jgi:preprotein translocase subunit SecG